MNTVLTKPEFKTWKTIKLGTGLKSAADFWKAIVLARANINERALHILEKSAFTVAACETEVELVTCSVAELGFKNGTTLKDIYECAEVRGLELCPPEVGPQLRLQYTDQPEDEWLTIAMGPITDSFSRLHLFTVVHDDDECWLYTSRGNFSEVWGGSGRFVFLRRK